jgi:hypothetical protein
MGDKATVFPDLSHDLSCLTPIVSEFYTQPMFFHEIFARLEAGVVGQGKQYSLVDKDIRKRSKHKLGLEPSGPSQ